MENIRDEFVEIVEEQKSEYINFLKELVRIDTRVIGHGIGGGRELAGQKFLEKKVQSIGGDTDLIPISEDTIQKAIEKHGEGNSGHNYEDRPNLVGHFPGKGSGRSLILNGHVDTMPYGKKEDWTHDPFSGRLSNDRLYGLGSSDMKSGLAAFLLAVETVFRAGFEFEGDVLFQSVVDEEGGGNGTLALVQEGFKADGAIIAEPTNLNLEIAHMGFIFYEINIRGKSVHSSRKSEGVSAIKKAFKVYEGLHELEHEWLLKHQHPILPPPSLNIGEIQGGTAGSTVPDNCTLKLCLHYQPEMNKEDIKSDVETALEEVIAGDAWLEDNPIEYEIYQQGGGYKISRNSELVKQAIDVLPENTNITGSPAGNDARLLHNVSGTDTVVIGPGKPEEAHSTDETVSIKNFLKSIMLYAEIISRWTGVKK